MNTISNRLSKKQNLKQKQNRISNFRIMSRFEQLFHRSKTWRFFIENIFYFTFFTQINFEKVDLIDMNHFESNTFLKKKQKRFQKLKNQMKNMMQTHKKEFEKTIIETNNHINKLLKTIQNKKKSLIF